MLRQIIDSQIFEQELQVSPEDHKILITEPPNNPKKNREEMVDMMMSQIDGFKVTRLYLGNQSVLSLFATGRTTGTVLDSGEGVTHAVPIYEGYAIPHAVQTINLSGRDLTSYLHSLLSEKSSHLISEGTSDLEEVKKIKERMCLVA